MIARDPPEAPGKWLSSSDFSDACDHLGIDAARTGCLRGMWRACPPVAGRLRTIRLEPATSGSPLEAVLELLAEAKDMILLVDLAGRSDCQGWGEVLATAARAFGVRGALVNGGVRDLAELERLAFPTYARSVFPGSMAGRLALAGVDETVHLEGAAVDAGDFVVADGDGLVAFAPADRDRVVSLAAARRADEREALAAVARGADPRSVFGRPEPT
jgi:4-hydroxy-4-methyl-2-oxoglutarate aldolase